MYFEFWWILLFLANFTQCSGNGKLFDECERHCDCINGSLQNCYRLRKEFTQMTKQERQRYLQVYMKLTTEQPYKNRYERFVYLHYKYFCYGIHRKDLFCPWHRFYILQMENLLREIDCRVTLPYWDWSYVGVDPWNGTDLWSDSDDGIGTHYMYIMTIKFNTSQICVSFGPTRGKD